MKERFGSTKMLMWSCLNRIHIFTENETVLNNIFFHDHPVINAIKEYEAADDEGNEDKLSAAIIKMDELGAWDFETKVKQMLGKLNIHHLQQNSFYT